MSCQPQGEFLTFSPWIELLADTLADKTIKTDTGITSHISDPLEETSLDHTATATTQTLSPGCTEKYSLSVAVN